MLVGEVDSSERTLFTFDRYSFAVQCSMNTNAKSTSYSYCWCDKISKPVKKRNAGVNWLLDFNIFLKSPLVFLKELSHEHLLACDSCSFVY